MMSAWKEMMTQEEAMNMSNEQAIQILIPMRNMMCDQNGCPISDAVFALDKAIKSLSADVAEVVRCKDCKCWTEWANGTGSCNRFTLDWIGTDADDFCSMGERKDDE